MRKLQSTKAVLKTRGFKPRIFDEAGVALRQIREKKLYRSFYKTFEDYCRSRFGFARRHSYQLIDAAIVVDNLLAIETPKMCANRAQNSMTDDEMCASGAQSEITSEKMCANRAQNQFPTDELPTTEQFINSTLTLPPSSYAVTGDS